jgi:hypothetical protein
MPMDYTTLVGSKDTEGSIKYFVRHSEVPSDYILDRAQSAIYSLLRVREMLVRTEGTIATDATTLAMPSGLLHPILLMLRGSYKTKIRLFDQEHFEQRIGEDENNDLYPGTPTQSTFDGTTFYFDVKADQDYPYRLWYVGTPALLGSGNTTNFLTSRYSHIIEAMCKSYAYGHRNDSEQEARWLEKATAYITKANDEFDMFNQSIQMELYWSRS